MLRNITRTPQSWLAALTVLAIGSPLLSVSPARANPQTNVSPRLVELNIAPMELNRAKNYARQAAEQINGGLGEYRAEADMHSPSADSPYRINDDGTLTFTFLGRAPAASTYTVETTVTVDPDAWTVNVNYNGPIRSR